MTWEITDRALAEADEIIIRTMNEQTLAGLGVGIVHEGTLIYARGFGLAEIESPRPVTPDTVFRIGSISKTFTAIGLMQLYEQGKFRLDDPVNDYLTTYRIRPAGPQAPLVTFRHLLTHTGGIGEVRHWSDLFRPMIGLGAKPGEPIPTPAEYYRNGLATDAYPGTKWSYANHAFVALGQVIEEISGQPFAAYMRQHVLDPLGMAHSDYLRHERGQRSLAIGYQFRRGRLRPVPYLEIAVTAAGSIFSSVNDMARYLTALLNGGHNEHGTVLQPATLHLMLEPHYRLDPHLPAMGLAFMLFRLGRHRLAGHDGGWAGFVSSMLFAPDDNLGVVVFTNTSNQAPSLIAFDLMCQLLDVPASATTLPRPHVLETPYLWPELTGAYGPAPGLNTNARIWLGLGGEVEVVVRDGHLVLRSLAGHLFKGARLYPIDPDDPLVFAIEDERQRLPLIYRSVAFQRNEAGQIDRLCIGFDRLYKRPTSQSLRYRLIAGSGTLTSLAVAGLVSRLARKR